MIGLEEAQHLLIGLHVERGKVAAVPDKGAARIAAAPVGEQVAPVGAAALLVGIFGIGHGGGQEIAASPAQDNVELGADRILDHLARDIQATVRLGCDRHVAVGFPVALRRMGIGRGGRGMGDARGRDDAGGAPRALREIEDRRDMLVFRA